MTHLQRITPCPRFNGQAEAAAKFYVSIFENSRMGDIPRYGDVGPGKKGTVLTVTFHLNGLEFMFTEAVSFIVHCDTQEEIDTYWDRLSAGGQAVQCGWLTDQFGLSWQIVPSMLGRMLQDRDAEKANHVMAAVLRMVKPDIKRLQQAYAGNESRSRQAHVAINQGSRK